MKPKKSDSPEFSPNDVVAFLQWLNLQPDDIKKIFEQTPSFAIRTMRNMKRGLPPLNPRGVPRVRL